MKYLKILSLIVLISLITGCSCQNTQVAEVDSPSTATTSTTTDLSATAIEYTEGTTADKDVISFQTILAELFVAYKDAQLLSMASVNLEFENTSLEQLSQLESETVTAWELVEQKADELAAWQPALSFEQLLKKIIPAAQAYRHDFRSIQKFDEGSEKRALAHKWEKVEMLQKQNPDQDLIKIVSEQFGTTAKKSNELIQNHYNELSQNYGDDVKMYDTASKTAQGLKTASKVGLFVTGAIATAGGSAVLSMPVGTALTTALSAKLGVGATTAILVEGVDVSMQVDKDISLLVFGDEDRAANIQVMQDYLSPATTFLSLKNLATNGLKDPANFVTIADWGTSLLSSDSNTLVSIQEDGVVVDDGYAFQLNLDDSQIDGQFPTGYQYQLLQALINKTKEVDATQGLYKGVWRGEVTVSLAPGIIVTPEIKLLIDDYGDATITISGSEDLSLGGGINQTHSISSEFTGEVKDDEINAEGSFNYTGKVDLPAGVQLPAEYQHIASGINSVGVLTLTGTVSNDKFVGSVMFSAETGDNTGQWSATRR